MTLSHTSLCLKQISICGRKATHTVARRNYSMVEVTQPQNVQASAEQSQQHKRTDTRAETTMVEQQAIEQPHQPLHLKPSLSQQESGSTFSSRHVDPAAVRQVFYFDTLAFSKKLEASGFTRQQAEVCAQCLVEIVNTTLDHQGRHMVSKPQQEIAVQQLMSEIVSVKKDMTLLQKSEFSSLKTETEKISYALTQSQDHMNDEIVKLKGQFSLDINLERGRSIEAHAENEKRLQQLHNKIDTEIANLKTVYEMYRNDIFKHSHSCRVPCSSCHTTDDLVGHQNSNFNV